MRSPWPAGAAPDGGCGSCCMSRPDCSNLSCTPAPPCLNTFQCHSLKPLKEDGRFPLRAGGGVWGAFRQAPQGRFPAPSGTAESPRCHPRDAPMPLLCCPLSPASGMLPRRSIRNAGSAPLPPAPAHGILHRPARRSRTPGRGRSGCRRGLPQRPHPACSLPPGSHAPHGARKD